MASTIFFSLALAASAAARSHTLSAAAVPIGHGSLDQYGPYYQGDMRFGEGQLEQVKSGIIGNQYRWPNAQVAVNLDSTFSDADKNTVIDGLLNIMDGTCIQFYYFRPGTDTDYVDIVKGASGSGCWSYVGRQGGRQVLNLQKDGCLYKGICAHEAIHALGYFHEQSRSDRDDYVNIQFQNIQNGTEHNFDKYSPNQVSSNGVPYDYGSIMHYGPTAFSKNGQPTIVAKNGDGRNMGQRNGLSDRDRQKLNNMYCKA